MKDLIFIKNSYQKLIQGGYTMFLDQSEQKQIIALLRKEFVSYQTFQLFEECDKVLLYQGNLPKIALLEITSNQPLEHRSIMGSLFSFGLDVHTFGDILIQKHKSYVVVLPQIRNLILYQLNQIGSIPVSVREVPFTEISFYHRVYQSIEVKVPSLRIDAVLAKLLHISRSQVEEKIKQKEVLLNYEMVKKGTKELKEDDVFSIRKYGKYRLKEILFTTKKGDLVLWIQKYQ